MFSDRIRNLGISDEENELTRIKREKETQSIPVLDLMASNPTLVGLEFPINILSHNLDKSFWSKYNPDPKGLPQTREAISSSYRTRNLEINPEDLILTASTSEAYSFIFKLLANPNDEILIPAPGYPLFPFLAELENISLKEYSLTFSPESKEWNYSLEEVKRQISSRTKLVLLVSPANPTGSVMRKEDWKEWLDWSEKTGIVLVLDEVFADYTNLFTDKSSHFYPVTDSAPVFVLNGISKMLALPQMKLSWIHVQGNPSFKKQALSGLEIISDSFLSVNSPIQTMLPELLPWKSMVQNRILNRIKRNVMFAQERFAEISRLTWTYSDAGWYGMIQIQNSDLSSEEWAEKILSEKNVYLHPGDWYGFPETETVLIVSLIAEEETFSAAAEKLADIFL
ncbi:pyridoxal phosphate-dependent aminotransferase [Leptospira idonii]|nr:pyridoxal phosphate-dependent aminotransferase [Leptospira idonii]